MIAQKFKPKFTEITDVILSTDKDVIVSIQGDDGCGKPNGMDLVTGKCCVPGGIVKFDRTLVTMKNIKYYLVVKERNI